jgi:signal transduction histidine kinase
MKAANSSTILIELSGASAEKQRGLIAENITANLKFSETIQESTAVLRKFRPDIALLRCESRGDCKNRLNDALKSAPGVLLILLANLETSELTELDEEFTLFAAAKPEIADSELISILKKAVTTSNYRLAQIKLRERRILRRRMPAQWLMSEENSEKTKQLGYAQALIRNILHSASQGLGIGAVITYIDMMQMGMQTGMKTPDPELFSSLLINTEATRQWLRGFENILKGLQTRYTTETLNLEAIQTEIAEAVASSEHFRLIKNQELVVETLDFTGEVSGNSKAIREIVSELLLNAYKYSPDASQVRLHSYSTGEYIAVTVINAIMPMNGGITGIPASEEPRVFEPFHRLNNTWDDRFREQKFGLGVGLTLAEHAAHQINGRIYVYELDLPIGGPESPENSGSRKVVAELVLKKVRRS